MKLCMVCVCALEFGYFLGSIQIREALSVCDTHTIAIWMVKPYTRLEQVRFIHDHALSLAHTLSSIAIFWRIQIQNYLYAKDVTEKFYKDLIPMPEG